MRESNFTSNLEKTSNFLNNAFQLAVTTALRLADLSSATPEDTNQLQRRISDLSMNNNLTALCLVNPPKTPDKADQLQRRISDLSVSNLPEITLDQVSWHDHYDDCWIVLYDRVYDITEFLQDHPGGADVLLEYAGRDATLGYRGFGHSAQAWQILQKYLIGVLPEQERMGVFKEEKFIARNLQLRAASS